MAGRFAQRVFTWSGVYGLIVLTPQYFLASRIGRDTPPPITHVEYFYGFIGIALAWQIVFLVIGRDPVRFRPLMVPAVLEKLAFGIPAIALFAQGRLPASVRFFGLVDLVLAALFVRAWLVTPRAGSPPSDPPRTVGRRVGA